jgi:hypothetical protein
MSLFGTLFGGGVNKNALIKDLVRLRIRHDPMAAQMGFDESMVDSLSGLQLVGLPEATIATIVETWSILRKRGMSDAEIFQRIDNHRSKAFPCAEIPSAITLTDYVQYRVCLEHSHGAPIDSLFVDAAVEVAKRAYVT